MKTAVIGAGAIGSLAAGYLADKGESVILVARAEQRSAIEKNGLVVEGARGRLTVTLPVVERLEEEVDLAVLATKIGDLESAVKENATCIGNARLLTVQNGVRAEEMVAGILGGGNLFASIVMFGATYDAPGRVLHNFEGDWILGATDASGREALDEIAAVTSKAFPTKVSDDIVAMKWLKLFLNANNCLPAILGKSMQETFASIPVCKISIGIWKEGWSLVNEAGIAMASLPDFPLDRIAGLTSLPSDKAAGIFSGIMTGLSKEPLYGSILQSIRRGRPSEIDYMNGEFVAVAGSIGKSAPLNEKLVRMVHQVEADKSFCSEEDLIEQTKELLD
ncbi:MAG: ketopantoate reductase family protein [Planctomycetota bacterium]|jgi:2-dehydropantoate 2-reductase